MIISDILRYYKVVPYSQVKQHIESICKTVEDIKVNNVSPALQDRLMADLIYSAKIASENSDFALTSRIDNAIAFLKHSDTQDDELLLPNLMKECKSSDMKTSQPVKKGYIDNNKEEVLKAINSEKGKAIMDRGIEPGFFNPDYSKKKMQKCELYLWGLCFCAELGISVSWKAFDEFWGVKNLGDVRLFEIGQKTQNKIRQYFSDDVWNMVIIKK